MQLSDLVMLIPALMLGGAATGLFAGIFGIGGGAVLIPVLYEVFRIAGVPEVVRMQLCVGTSLAIIIPTSIISFRGHFARGTVDLSILKKWAVPAITGVLIGSAIAKFAPEALFKLVFVAVALATAIRLLFGRDSWRLADDFPSGWLMKGFGFLIGLLSSLMGIGGGQISNLLMTLYNRPIHQAVATSAGLGIIISLPGTIGYIYAGWSRAADYPDVAALQFPLALGYISLVGFVLVMPLSAMFAPLGVRLAHALSKRQLEIAFGAFLLAVSLRFLGSLLLA